MYATATIENLLLVVAEDLVSMEYLTVGDSGGYSSTRFFARFYPGFFGAFFIFSFIFLFFGLFYFFFCLDEEKPRFPLFFSFSTTKRVESFSPKVSLHDGLIDSVESILLYFYFYDIFFFKHGWAALSVLLITLDCLMILFLFFTLSANSKQESPPSFFLRPQLALGNTTVSVLPCPFIISPRLISHQSSPVIGASVPPFAT
ncbi:hypothetical protein HDV62DRAFT_81520 [Trichoderma sp. SZMC 28011]